MTEDEKRYESYAIQGAGHDGHDKCEAVAGAQSGIGGTIVVEGGRRAGGDLSCTGDHVLNVVRMPWAVHMRIMPLVRLVLDCATPPPPNATTTSLALPRNGSAKRR